MGGNDDDRDDDELWTAQFLQSLKAEHDRLFKQLHDESTRLERELSRDDNMNSSAGPFSAFKKFIDHGITSLFPTSTAEPTPTMYKADQVRLRAEELDIVQRWTGSSDSLDHIHLQNSRTSAQEKEEALDSTAELLELSERHNRNVPAEMIQALYHDDTFDVPGVFEPPQPRWLSVNWFKRSPYSPIRLEAHPDMGQHGAKWRAAFEDLLNASLGKPIGSIERVGARAPHGRPQSTYYGPGLEWMLSLSCRGILPPQLPRTYNTPSAALELRSSSISQLLEEKMVFYQEEESSMSSPLSADFDELLSEVGTKATADTEEIPKPPLPVCIGHIDIGSQVPPRCGGENMWPEEFENERSTGDEPTDSQLLKAASQALSGDDVREAADLLTAVHERGIDINSWWLDRSDRKKLRDRLAFCAEALGASKVPEHSLTHQVLRDEINEDADRMKYVMSSKERNPHELYGEERSDLMMLRHLIVRGDWSKIPIGWQSLEQLREEVERLEQEYENFEHMTGGEATRTTGGYPTDPDSELWPYYNILSTQAKVRFLKIMAASRNSTSRNNERESLDRALQEYELRQQNQAQAKVKRDEPDAPRGLAAPTESKILSALTTTHTTRLPDGTVTTKVVLKQRFADGREETTESLHTSNEKREGKQTEEKQEKSGWFWS